MTAEPQSTAIAFIGLGNMGAVMSQRLLAAGFTVRGYDLAAPARAALTAAGGVAGDGLEQTVESADVVILMLPDSNAVNAVVHDQQFRLKAGAVVVDMGSSEPLLTRKLADELAAAGHPLVDAPVSGGVKGAHAGTLTIMTGGDETVLEALQPVFAPMGRVVHVGPVGAGHAVKSLNNLLSATHLLATAEAIAAGQEFGLSPEAMLVAFNGSSGRSGSTENKWPNFVLSGSYDSGFALGLMLKDMRIALSLAEQVGTSSQLSAEAVRRWGDAAAALPPTADHTEIARWVADLGEMTPAASPGEPELTARQETVKAAFIEQRSTWSDLWQGVLELDPDFLESYLNLSMVPWRKNHLSAKVKELIYIAVDANATHMYLPGVRQHIKAALQQGATKHEIMEVLELCATLGIHAMNVGVPILVEVLEEKGLRTGPEPLDDFQRAQKEEFTRARGYWHEFFDNLLELDPEMFAAYTEFSSVPWRSGTLDPKVKELIYISFDAASTHLYTKGLKLHIENAIGYGATPQEIIEVMEIASVLGIHAVTTAAPILLEEAAEFEQEATRAK